MNLYFGLWANEFETWGMMFAIGGTAEFEWRTISGTQRGAVFVEANICGRQTSEGIKGNNGLLKSAVTQQNYHNCQRRRRQKRCCSKSSDGWP